MTTRATVRSKTKRPSATKKVRLEHLDNFRVAHLATADHQGRPLVVPLCFACGKDAIYSVVDEKPKRVAPARLRRLRNIQTNGQVCFLVDHYQEDWTRLAYILVEGTAEILTEEAEGTEKTERAEALQLLRQKYAQYRTMQLEDKPVIKISPHRLISWKAT